MRESFQKLLPLESFSAEKKNEEFFSFSSNKEPHIVRRRGRGGILARDRGHLTKDGKKGDYTW
jgi:hypothetical protein